MNVLLFSIGAALGAPLRFWVDNKFRPKYKFPIGIFIVNIAGSFLIGLFATHMNYFVVGFCGALTTWSTFIVDLFLEAQNRA
ncbi:MAG: fluoride efflux transporter FluC [Candidatus Nanopelagicaceae bacterium]